MPEDATTSLHWANWFAPGRRELPYAAEAVHDSGNHWGWLRSADGTTGSESRLLRLVRSSVLSLWSYPNPFVDHGLSRNGGGKELCDLLVIFGDDVLLFSDKECAFTSAEDPQVAWSRWYRRAIEKSCKQLAGAEAAIRKPHTRLFVDARCTTELPVPLPLLDRMRVHLIAVAHGSVEAAERYWEAYGGGDGSSGSLVLNTGLVGVEHEREPFQVGWPLGKGRFVHVLDSLSLSLLLQELSTAADFIDYLTKRATLLRDSGCDFMVPGEEELLTTYLTTLDHGRFHRFPHFEPGTYVILKEGSWLEYKASPLYRERTEANELSHLWDDLIEYQASHVIHGSAHDAFDSNGQHDPSASERLLRTMASENRISRRSLGATLRQGRAMSSDRQRWLRTIASPSTNRVYCFLFLPYFPQQQSHDDYRNYRQYLLHLYIQGALLRFPEAKQVIGIAPDPYNSDRVSVDFMFGEAVGEVGIGDDERAKLEAALRAEGIWSPENIRARTFYDVAYPPPMPTLAQRVARAARRLADNVRRRRKWRL